MQKPSIRVICLACVLVLAACAPRPELPSRSNAVPVGVDLSGSWEIRHGSSNGLARVGEHPQTIQMPRQTTSTSQPNNTRQPQSRRKPKSGGADVWIFLETGNRLKITQTDDGLFISFDRAVVEAYTFGENRTVSVGPIEAQRVSGWDGDELVLETMDEQANILTETWSLAEDGAVLVREVSVVRNGKELYATIQIFDRV